LLERAGEVVMVNHHGRDVLIPGIPNRIRCEDCGQAGMNDALPIGTGRAALLGAGSSTGLRLVGSSDVA